MWSLELKRVCGEGIMKIEIDNKVKFYLHENEGYDKENTPYFLTIWAEDNEIVISLNMVEYEQLKKALG